MALSWVATSSSIRAMSRLSRRVISAGWAAAPRINEAEPEVQSAEPGTARRENDQRNRVQRRPATRHVDRDDFLEKRRLAGDDSRGGGVEAACTWSGSPTSRPTGTGGFCSAGFGSIEVSTGARTGYGAALCRSRFRRPPIKTRGKSWPTLVKRWAKDPDRARHQAGRDCFRYEDSLAHDQPPADLGMLATIRIEVVSSSNCSQGLIQAIAL